jgi:hypothetical protein
MSHELTFQLICVVALTAFVSALFAEAAKELWAWVKSKFKRKH